MSARLVVPVHFPDLTERSALKLAAVLPTVARAHFARWHARMGRAERAERIFTPLVHVEVAVTDVPIDPSSRLRISGRSRLGRVLDTAGEIRMLVREGAWRVAAADGREVARARLVNAFARDDEDPARRRVTELPTGFGLGSRPSRVVEVPGTADLVPETRSPDLTDRAERVWHYGQTDPNRHVNASAYLRSLEEFAATELHRLGHDLRRAYPRRARLVYRKPCFRGQPYRRVGWLVGEAPLVVAAAVVPPGAGARPAVAAELSYALHPALRSGSEGSGPPSA